MSDDGENERIPLHEGVGVNSPSMQRRWPNLLLGAVVGLATAVAIGGFMGKPLLGGATVETTCGAVPTLTHPPGQLRSSSLEGGTLRRSGLFCLAGHALRAGQAGS